MRDMMELEKAYAGVQTAPLGDNILAQISGVADDIRDLMEEIAADEADVKAKKERLRQMQEDTLPGLMEAAGQTQVKTLSGVIVTLDEAIFANITEERKSAAFQWLVDNGHEALIRNEFKVAFPKGKKADAEAFEDYLNKNLRKSANLKHTTSVHTSTLTSFVREELEAGHELPHDLLGIRRRKICKIDT